MLASGRRFIPLRREKITSHNVSSKQACGDREKTERETERDTEIERRKSQRRGPNSSTLSLRPRKSLTVGGQLEDLASPAERQSARLLWCFAPQATPAERLLLVLGILGTTSPSGRYTLISLLTRILSNVLSYDKTGPIRRIHGRS